MNFACLEFSTTTPSDLLIMERFKQNGCQPVIWTGAAKSSAFAPDNKRFPDCTFLCVIELALGATIKNKEDFEEIPNKQLLRSRKFFLLKDQALKIMDRQDDVGIYNRLEREALFYSLFLYYYSLVKTKKVDFLICSDAPHVIGNLMLYGVCDILDIPTYHLTYSSVLPLFYLSRNFYGNYVKILKNSTAQEKWFEDTQLDPALDSIQILSGHFAAPSYMTAQKNYDKNNGLKQLYKHCKGLLRGIFRHSKKKPRQNVNQSLFLEKNHQQLFHQIFIELRRTQLKESYLSGMSKVSLEDNFVFFPLHYEPERTSLPDGGHYYQTYDALVALREFVPNDIPIYIKEHYSQFSTKLVGYRGRSPYFYKVIQSLPNVFLVDPFLSSEKFINRAFFTATQTGTASFEAACLGRKAVLFGYTNFSNCPNTYSFDELNSYEELLSEKIHSREDIKQFFRDWTHDYGIASGTDFMSSFVAKSFPKGTVDFMFNNDLRATQIVEAILSDCTNPPTTTGDDES